MSVFKQQILIDYEKCSLELQQAQKNVQQKLSDLLKNTEINVHIRSRLKSADSLKGKISKPDKNYDDLWDVTDILGYRIVTPFEDSIENINKVIENNFQIDFSNTQDRSGFIDHDKFGYKSVHYICFFPDQIELPKTARFEIQIRTALQDVWAEIEHVVAYKADGDMISPDIRRRFSRISSLLEIADEEFVNIKAEVQELRRNKQSLNLEESNKINSVSLEKIAEHELIKSLDLQIAKFLNKDLSHNLFSTDYITTALKAADLHDTKRILQQTAILQPYLNDFLPIYFAFAEENLNLKRENIATVDKLYSLLFIAHLNILKKEVSNLKKRDHLKQFYLVLDNLSDESATSISNNFIKLIDLEAFK